MSFLSRKAKIFFVESSGTVPPCPSCHGKMHYRDSRKRIMRKEGGKVCHLMIRRFRCEECRHYHNELPDCLIPYKHYGTEVISGVIDGTVTASDLDSEDYPCLMTMLRWIRWFRENLSNVEGYLRKVCSHLGQTNEIILSGVSLLRRIYNTYPDWLERIIRIIYNSGGYLASVADPPCTCFVLNGNPCPGIVAP